MVFRRFFCVGKFSLFLLLPWFALAKDTADQAGIRLLIMQIWDKPETSLLIDPVVVEGDFAVASWIQGERGGRAILAKRDNHWQVIVCTGDGALSVANLVQTGMPTDTAGKLVDELKTAEQVLPEERRQQFSRFGASVRMTGSHHQH